MNPRRILYFSLVLTLSFMFFFNASRPTPVYAGGSSVSETSYSVTCSSFTASGLANVISSGYYISFGIHYFVPGATASTPPLYSPWTDPNGAQYNEGAQTVVLADSNGAATGTVTWPAQPAGTLIYISVYPSYSDGSYHGGGYFWAVVSCVPAPVALGIVFADSRLNSLDAGQTFALYCTSSGSVIVYSIDAVSSNGWLAFVASPAEIAAVSRKPTVNTAIKSGGGATLYRLTSGQLQVNRPEKSGKMYSYIFSDCATS